MNALLDKLEREQAAGWPTPPTWGPGDVYPDPVLAEYVTLIRHAVTSVSRSNTRAHGRMGVHSKCPGSATNAPGRDREIEAPDVH